ncbi:hypothetical protein [Thermosynechococcus sp. Uc]|uniref:peptide ligase PGM1-related protein n=1 Tax=Thermosynechococcus sp. Uc TaxID=3034853 RepID=UPI00345B98C8
MIARYHLHFDSSTATGTVFHLMGALSAFGKLGLLRLGIPPKKLKPLTTKPSAFSMLRHYRYLMCPPLA